MNAPSASLVPDSVREPFHILVVEDEVITRSVAAEFLRESGFVVVEAASGDEAWHYLISGGKANLVFTDLKMPGAIQGGQLINHIQANFPAIKTIVTSGNGGPFAAVTYSEFMQKPYDLDEVLDCIVKSLGIDSP
ncbi:response regulator [Dongia soli]|uniref:Response regulator n=1 Tax=Dongia soli TaxID=600628 RepID=A0ABU5EF71_9PROT|nr:response regulator [Dongia soli]MDY0885001.1 response regulator [Dongia soli]